MFIFNIISLTVYNQKLIVSYLIYFLLIYASNFCTVHSSKLVNSE